MLMNSATLMLGKLQRPAQGTVGGNGEINK